MKAKGTVLVGFVKTIKADKSGVYDKYLTAEDKTIISQKILPNIWYPYETFRRCFNAVFEVIAKKDLEQVRNWGKLYGQAIMSDLYKGVLKKDDPIGYLKNSQVFIRNFFDFGRVEVVVEGENQILLKLIDFDPQFAPVHYMIRGWMERTAELCGAKDLKVEFVTKGWEGDPHSSIRLSWSQ